jgi:uncharacterized protein VirK/YbjX
MQGVRPRTALLFALEGVAEAFGIGEVAAVSAGRHGSYSSDIAVLLTKAYDDFFADLGLSKNSSGFFLIPVPLEEPPLEAISPGNRQRSRKNRAFKQEVRLSCANFFAKVHPTSSNN